MSKNYLALYDALIDGVKSEAPVRETAEGDCWAMAAWSEGMGLGMMTPGTSVAPRYPGGLTGLSLRDAAKTAISWNLREASFGLAAANAYYNTPARLAALGCGESMKNYPTVGIDLEGKTIGLVGHMHGPQEMREKAKAVYILERAPKPGDYPDPACDWILQQDPAAPAEPLRKRRHHPGRPLGAHVSGPAGLRDRPPCRTRRDRS